MHFSWCWYRLFCTFPLASPRASKEGDNLDDAISNTMKVSGRILFNGISVIVGFSVLMFSVFMPLKEFQYIIMASIGFCLIGGMAILPALVSLVKPKFLYK